LGVDYSLLPVVELDFVQIMQVCVKKKNDIFFWLIQGEDASIEAAVMAISNCLREPVSPNNCSEVK
jgi:hypothetical protein